MKYLVVFCAIFVLGFVATRSVMAGKSQSPPRGAIWFGTSYRTSSVGDFLIVGKKTSFRPPGRIAWIARFSGKAGQHRLRFSLWKISDGKRTEVWHGPQHVSNLKTNEIANRMSLKDIVELGAKPGWSYTIRYSRGVTVLASGGFRLFK